MKYIKFSLIISSQQRENKRTDAHSKNRSHFSIDNVQSPIVCSNVLTRAKIIDVFLAIQRSILFNERLYVWTLCFARFILQNSMQQISNHITSSFVRSLCALRADNNGAICRLSAGWRSACIQPYTWSLLVFLLRLVSSSSSAICWQLRV